MAAFSKISVTIDAENRLFSWQKYFTKIITLDPAQNGSKGWFEACAIGSGGKILEPTLEKQKNSPEESGQPKVCSQFCDLRIYNYDGNVVHSKYAGAFF
jgi:hypothetical protein